MRNARKEKNTLLWTWKCFARTDWRVEAERKEILHISFASSYQISAPSSQLDGLKRPSARNSQVSQDFSRTYTYVVLFGLEWARKGNCHWCNFYTIIYACKLNLKLSAHYLKGLRTGIMNDWTNEWKVWCRRGVKRVKSGHFSAKITSMGIHSCGF